MIYHSALTIFHLIQSFTYLTIPWRPSDRSLEIVAAYAKKRSAYYKLVRWRVLRRLWWIWKVVHHGFIARRGILRLMVYIKRLAKLQRYRHTQNLV